MPKQFTVSINCVVDSKVSKRQLAAEIEKAVKSVPSIPAEIGDIEVKLIDRSLRPAGSAAGYESRLWEKATCKIAVNPADLVTNPVVNPVANPVRKRRNTRGQR